MADSTTNLDLIQQSQAQKEVTANNLFDAFSSTALGGRRSSTTNGLTWGYYGGAYYTGSVYAKLANGTKTLTANATNYLEFNPSTGAVSVNTSSWTNGLIPWYKIVCGAATTTSYEDFRVGPAGTQGGGGSVITLKYLVEDSTNLTTAPTVAAGTKSWALFEGAKILTGANQSIAYGTSRNAGTYSMTWNIGSNTNYGISSTASQYCLAWGSQATISNGSYNISFGYNNQVAATQYGVAIGQSNVIPVSSSFCYAFGASNNIAGTPSHVYMFGYQNGAGGTCSYSFVSGEGHSLQHTYATISGRYGQTRRTGDRILANSRYGTTTGSCQQVESVLSTLTTSANPTELGMQGAPSNKFQLQTGYVYTFEGLVSAGDASGNCASWKISGCVKNIGGVVSAVGTPSVVSLGADAAASTWVFEIDPNSQFDALIMKITAVTGVKCMCILNTTEMTFL
ncbi:hypothetical protein [Flavobacterium sp.]|jgi:hypothetical protein|uniref:hypothetical protein n=1 Tax=Flavobacterium sp. TaxID=239 RepID=UPI0037BFF30B